MLHDIQLGQHVQVIDPEDGYYLQEGEVVEVRGRVVYVRFADNPDEERFKLSQLRSARQAEGQDGD